jgi:hypothetical protein
MRLTRWLPILLGLGIVPASCGGASPTNLLDPDAAVNEDSGSPVDSGTPADVMQSPDVITVVDSSPPMDTGAIKDTAQPPPVDTGTIDVGPVLPPLYCGTTTTMPCEAMTHECCVDTQDGTTPTYKCQVATEAPNCMADGNTPVACGQAADCPGQQCCGTVNFDDTAYDMVQCEAMCDPSSEITFCSPSGGECEPLGETCQTSDLLPGYMVCK